MTKAKQAQPMLTIRSNLLPTNLKEMTIIYNIFLTSLNLPPSITMVYNCPNRDARYIDKT